MAEPKKNGRPRRYTKELANEICERISNGESLRSICREKGMPVMSTILGWRSIEEYNFSKQYEDACSARAHYWAEELLDITDDSSNDYMERNDPDNPGYIANGESVARSRLRVDTRKWLLSKVLPKYADKPIEPASASELSVVVAQLIAKLPG